MPGRKSDELHILEGTFRADRHGDPQAAVVAAGTPEPPERLGGEALARWRQVVPLLVEMGVVGAVDSEALAVMCEWHARYARLGKELDQMPAGSKQLYPTLVQTAVCFDKYEKIAARFGLDPVSRSRLRGPAKSRAGVASRRRG